MTRGHILLRPITWLMVLALAMVLAVQAGTASAVPDGETFTLTVLHNNDGESDLLASEGEGGAALFKGLVDARRAAATNSILVSSGDNFLAGPEWTAGTNAGIFYDAIVLEALGYDAISLGNHDFDFGPDILNDFIDSFTNPPTYVSANVDLSPVPALDAQDIVPSTVVSVNGESVGIIGAITPVLATISSPSPVIVQQDVAGLVQAEIDALTNQGVEIIVLISHLQGIDEDLELASQLTDIDIMVAGGGDELLANETTPLLSTDSAEDIFGPYPIIATDANANEIPVVTTSGSYGYLGELTVEFNDQGVATSWSGEPIRVVQADGITPDSGLESSVVTPLTAALDAFETNVIATSQVDLNGVRADIRTKETNQGNLIADAFLWEATKAAPGLGLKTPQVAFANGGGIRNDSVVPAGDLTELDTFGMLPFLNFVTVVEDVPPAQFKEILENAVSRVEFTDGRFAQIAGASVIYDPGATGMEIDVDGTVLQAGNRVRSAILADGTAVIQAGQIVPGAQPVTIVLVDFLARGGDQYPVRDLDFTLVGTTYQQALSNYLTAPVADGGLGGVVSADQYPVGGEGRVVALETNVNDYAALGGVNGGGQWLVPGADAPFFYGNPGDTPFLGDWNGDGVQTPGLYRPSTGFAYVRDTNDFGVADREWFMGNPGDIPLVGDWDGDGTDSFGVYRPSEGKVYLRNAQTTGFADVEYYFGNPGDAPFAGDFDGDGIDTVGLFRETAGLVYFRNTQTTGVAESEFFFGIPGDKFVGGDWDGDGIDTVGVLRGDTFFGRNSNNQGFADFMFQVDSRLAPIVSRPVQSFERLLQRKNLTTLAAAFDILAENGLLPPPGTPSTFFAPTDAAFEALPPGLLDAALADPFFLAEIVGYHGVPEALTQPQLIDAGFLSSFTGSPLGFSEGSLLVNGVEASPAIRTPDGYVAIIDEVLQPPEPEALFVARDVRGTTEVPDPGEPTAFGNSFFNYTILGDTHLMCTFTWNTGGFVAGVTPNALHIHEGAAGVAGPVVWNSGATAEDFFPNGPFKEWAVDVCAEIDPTVAQNIIADPEGFYVNIHSPSFPGGMAREQLLVDPGFDPVPTAYHADPMTGSKEVGGGDPDSHGWVTLNVPTTDTGEWCFRAEAYKGDAITGAHIHSGVAGVDGDVVINFGVGSDAAIEAGDALFSVHDTFPFAGSPQQISYGCVAVDPTVASDIAAAPGDFYANIHSEAFPAGMIRAQLGAGEAPFTEILAELSGDQEVSVPGEGFGFAFLAFYENEGTVVYFIDGEPIGKPTAAHIHTGAAGVEGPVILDLGVGPDTFFEPGFAPDLWFGSGLVEGVDPGIITEIVGSPGDEYVNVHNEEFPGGVMRGQTFDPNAGPPEGLMGRSTPPARQDWGHAK